MIEVGDIVELVHPMRRHRFWAVHKKSSELLYLVALNAFGEPVLNYGTVAIAKNVVLTGRRCLVYNKDTDNTD